MPVSCYQVLAKDCTNEMKFMVLLKKDQTEQNHINVKIADMWVLTEQETSCGFSFDKTKWNVHFCNFSDIDLYPKNNEVILSVNGMEIPINNLSYQHPTGFHIHCLHQQNVLL